MKWIRVRREHLGGKINSRIVTHGLLKLKSHQVQFCILQLVSFLLNAASQLPQSETLSRSIRRQRQVPSANSNSQLSDHLKQTDRREKFLLHKDKEFTVFTTASNLSLLKTCKHWFADGTFKAREKKSFSFIHYLIVIGLLGRFLSNVYTARAV